MSDAAARALAFANGLRKSVATTGKRWAQWPGGAGDLAIVLACVEQIQQRLQAVPAAEDDEAAVAAAIANLRTILEWTTYQSAGIQTARALQTARKTRDFAERFGLLDNPAARLSVLVDSEESLLENVQTKNDYMRMLAAKHPHLGLPEPLVKPASLAAKVKRQPSRLELIAQLKKSAKKK
jgi:hypothetical protein